MNLGKIPNLLNLKKILPEFFIVIILCLITYHFSETPKLDLTPKKSDSQPTAPSEVKRHAIRNEKIMERNIFSIDGKYEGALISAPEEAYKLIAVLIGEEKKAVLRDFNGNTFTAKINDRMIDGFILSEIKEKSITLKRDGKTKELFIFKKPLK